MRKDRILVGLCLAVHLSASAAMVRAESARLAVEPETLRRSILANRALVRRFRQERDGVLSAPMPAAASPEERYARQLVLDAKIRSLESENMRLEAILLRHAPEEALAAGVSVRHWRLTADETISSK